MSKARRGRRQEQGGPPDGAWCTTPTAPQAGLRKASVTLREFAAPLLQDLGDAPLALVREALALACVAWNVEVGLGGEAEKQVTDHLASLPEDVADLARESIEILRARKRESFADDRRLFMNFTVERVGDSWHIQVLSMRAK